MRKAICLMVTILGLITAASACASKVTPAAPPQAKVVATPGTTVPQVRPTAPIPTERDQSLAKLITAAQREKKLNLYSFELVGDAGLSVSRAFKEKYGIDVDIVTGRGAEFAERIKTEQRVGQVVASLVQATPATVFSIKAAGHTASLADIPSVLEKDVWSVDPFVLDKDGHLIAHRYQTNSPLVNTQLVKPQDEPKSYKDLLQERWKGKIADGDPVITTGAYTVFITLMNQGLVDMDFLRLLGKQDIRFFTGTAEVVRVVAKGEYPIALVGPLVNAKEYMDQGAPIKALSMQEGTVVQVSTIAGVKNAPHPNAAKLFVNWVMSQEGQAKYTRPLGVFPVRKDVEAFIPPAGKVIGKLVSQTSKDLEDVTRFFGERFLVNLWKK